ncbi:hypothetical protein G5714_003918 [Onychostoma macrolepis]|uniref:Uncharacterized protein n=1 Tax=Onychostoma macrolepis TaxID=369639 RepID=A0A7J6DB51_9TELE|nr:hypothetical protein G5714_003918 [Onychostoma macrolepis]
MGLHGVLCSLAASLRSRGFQAVSATAEVLCGLGCAAFGAARARDLPGNRTQTQNKECLLGRDHCFYTAVIFSWYHADPQSDVGSTYTPPLPLLASPETRTGPVKTGGRHAPFDHKTAHFTVCQAPGQTAERQFFIKQLQRNVLKAGSETASVPVVTMKPADANPPAPARTTLLTHETIETIVLRSGSSNLSRRRLVLLVNSQRWFLYPLFVISKALSGTSTVPQRFLMLTVIKN